MKISIKNMVCNRCIDAVKNQLDLVELDYTSVELGFSELNGNATKTQLVKLKENLVKLGFTIIDDKKSKLVEQIKTTIIKLVHQKNADLKVNLSEFIQSEIGQDYHTLSTIFSELENTTIEKYFLLQKIERVKELIVYDELSLSEIAFKLHYSSASHLSNQFKKITGLSPSHFKTIKANKRKPLDEI